MMMHFCMVDEKHRTLKQNAKRYVLGGLFFIDFFSTFPSMIAFFYDVIW